MIDEHKDRFFASESLTGILTPEMLEEKSISKDRLILSLSDSDYEIHSMSEMSNSVEFTFVAKAQKLASVLNLDPLQVKIKCSNSVHSKDLTGYDVRSLIVNIENGEYRVTLQFTKNQAELING